MIPYYYDFLLVLMLALLYWAGNNLQKNNVKLLSAAGMVAILAYTLNEGLRFGRGIDYNLYWQCYLDFARGLDTHQNIGFIVIQKLFLFFNLPFQALVMFMSFMFILGTLLMMKHYREVVVFALPLWALFSKGTVENMVRWYLAFSFIMIGLSFLMSHEKRSKHKYLLFCFIGCTIHYAIFPIPLVFYFLYFRKTPLISPIKVIFAFAIISIFFETSFMLRFVGVVNYLGTISEKFSVYSENAEFWLTNNALGTDSSNIGAINILFCVFLAIVGYKSSIQAGEKYVFAYNLFLIGFMFRGLTVRVELLGRFDHIFFFYRAIVFATILKLVILRMIMVRYRFVVMSLSIFFLMPFVFTPLITPFKSNPMKYLYIWDSSGNTPQTMLQMYLLEKYKANSQFEKKSDRMKQFQRK